MSDNGATARSFAGVSKCDILVAVCPAIRRSTSELSKQNVRARKVLPTHPLNNDDAIAEEKGV